MTSSPKSSPTPPEPAGATRRLITLEQSYPASLEEVWTLWTTREGLEAWWGPEGFSVKVRSLDLRPGGKLHYAMIAIAPEQIEFMKRAGMPTTTETSLTFTEVDPPRRLAYQHFVDFVPGVAPYQAATVVELRPGPEGVRLSLTIEAMHDETWTQRAFMGWEMELGKLAKALGARAARPASPANG